MLFVLVTLFWYLVLGFMLAWLANLITREDSLELKTGVVILFVAWVVRFGADTALPNMPDAAWPAFNFAMLTLLLTVLGKLNFMHSMLIALIYSAALFGCLTAATSVSGG